MGNVNTVFFVSVIRTPNDMATSTHIMTNSLLKGIKENGVTVYFLAICEDHSKINDVKNYYKNIVDCVIPLKSVHGSINSNVKQLMAITKSFIFSKKHRDIVIEAVQGLPKPDLIISHSPSYESIYFAKELKLLYNTVLYEYWSDPSALSGINPENFGVKRWPYFILEKTAFRYADRIIYGTKTLMQFQMNLYKKYKNKMYYIDVPFVNEAIDLIASDDNGLLYAGNYMSAIRNIQPLADAVSKNKTFKLDVYGSGDVDLTQYDNVSVHGRITPQELSEIERKYKVIVCILNSSCIQIPGKIFYGMNNETDILVIADGRYKSQIIEYLETYKRFVLCENTQESIMDALNNKLYQKIDMEYILTNFSPQKVACDLLEGGNK